MMTIGDVLPRDLISAILLRLTFESVLVCKLVSKEWMSIIKDPRFIKVYRDKSMAVCVRGDRMYRFFFSQGNKLKRYPYCTAESLFEIKFRDRPKLLSGPSDNVVCIRPPGGVFFYTNLLTGECYTITGAPPMFHIHCYGFGYDACGDEYKLLIVCRRHSSGLRLCQDIRMDIAQQNKENSLFWVFSFRTYNWKSFDGFPYCQSDWLSNHSKAQSFSGFLHWVFYTNVRDNVKFLIATYDLHTCRSGEMTAPNGYDTSQAVVTEFDGTLCFLYRSALHEFEVWVMKEYGVAESWTNLFKFVPSSSSVRRNFMNIFELAYMAPYECEDGRKVVLFMCHHDKKLHWYDVTNNKLNYTTWQVKPSKLLTVPRKRKM